MSHSLTYFHFPFFMLILTMLSTSDGLTAQEGYLTDFQKKWQNAADYTLELAESMPEADYDFRPTPGQMSFREQLIHMVRNMNWLASDYLGGEKLDDNLRTSDYSKEQVLDILSRGFAASMSCVENLPAAALDEQVDFFAGPMNKRQILTLMNDHVTHHRGQLIVYLRLKQISPPKYRGW